MAKVCTLLILFLAFTLIYSKIELTKEQVLGYLEDYGYISSKNVSDEIYEEAIRLLQQLANITSSGEIDEETVLFLTSKRCGNKDIIIEPRIADANINPRRTYRIMKYTKKMERRHVDMLFVKGFAAWSRYSCLFFSRKVRGKADIEIYFTDERAQLLNDDKNEQIADVLARVTDDNSVIYFNESMNWSDTTGSNVISLFHVATHEIGHALGLSHTDIDSVMFSVYRPNFNDLKLQDVESIGALFGKRSSLCNF